jgi:hypothetical protein
MRDRKSSGGKLSKKQQEQAREEELRRMQEGSLPKIIPKLPPFTPTPQLQTFGGEDSSEKTGDKSKMSMETATRNVPMPPMPNQSQSLENVDPYARTESMTHRGRYSYAPSAVSSIDSPRRVRRRKDPTPYK